MKPKKKCVSIYLTLDNYRKLKKIKRDRDESFTRFLSLKIARFLEEEFNKQGEEDGKLD